MAENHDSPSATAADISSTTASNTVQPIAESSTKPGERNDLEHDEIERNDEQGESSLEEGEDEEDESEEAPPLPDEEVPPLPDELPPDQVEDDGWDPVWDGNAQAYYFYNRITGLSQWENPRVPSEEKEGGKQEQQLQKQVAPGAYNPAIHGDYDPTAPYAQQYEQDAQVGGANAVYTAEQLQAYAATGSFNRFTGKWQDSALAPENFNDENKSRRQMNAYFDVDAAANSHDGRSLKAERSGKKLSKAEVKAFREKRRERKEEKRRAWLRD